MAKRLMPKKQLEGVGLTLTGACVVLVALVVVTLIFMVAQQGLSAFFVDGIIFLSFITGTSWVPSDGVYGALPLIVTSFGVMLLAAPFTLPIALGSAIFVVEVQPWFGRRIFQPLVELLMGVPSVVYGPIGLTVVNAAMRAIFGEAAGTGAGILSGGIVLAVMILPTVTTLSIDGLSAVPQEYREGSYALGCTRWQTVWHVVLKSALPSLMTAVILGMTRAFGEALAVQMVIGGVEKVMPAGLLSPAATLTTALTSGFSNATTGSAQYHALWALGLLLMGMSLIFILIIHLIGSKGRRTVASKTSAQLRGNDLGIDLDEHVKKIGRQDRVATGILTAIVAFVLLLLASIVAFILFKGLGKALSPGFLTTSPLADENPGISSEIFDSFYMLVITFLISVPISLGAAIFLVEHAPDNWAAKAASTAIETLSSLPSIVVGMFGSLFFVVTLGWGISRRPHLEAQDGAHSR